MSKASDKQNAFPPTRRTWMGHLLDDGELDTARRHIMEAYAEPLRIYCRGCSLRWVGEPSDLVSGFFADRLSRPTFLERWRESGRPLRFWLIVGFKHFMLEEARRRKRDARGRGEPRLEPEGSGPDRAFDRACALELVRQALSQTERQCRDDGLGEHWEIFFLHHLRDLSIRQIAEQLSIDVPRAAVMKRTAANRFRATLRELVSWTDADDQMIDAEIRDLRGGTDVPRA